MSGQAPGCRPGAVAAAFDELCLSCSVMRRAAVSPQTRDARGCGCESNAWNLVMGAMLSGDTALVRGGREWNLLGISRPRPVRGREAL